MAAKTKRSGGQRLSLRTGAAALRRLLLHLFHLRRDIARLSVELRILGVMFLELADRVVRERTPVLVLFHVRNQRRLGANETRRFGAKPLRIHRFAMKGLGEVIDDLQLRVARLSKLLHIGAAIRVGRSGQSDGQNEPCPQCAKPFSCHRITSSRAAPDSVAQT